MMGGRLLIRYSSESNHVYKHNHEAAERSQRSEDGGNHQRDLQLGSHNAFKILFPGLDVVRSSSTILIVHNYSSTSTLRTSACWAIASSFSVSAAIARSRDASDCNFTR